MQFGRSPDLYEYLEKLYLNLKLRKSDINLALPEQAFYYYALVNSGNFIYPHLFYRYLQLHQQACEKIADILIQQETIDGISELYEESLKNIQEGRIFWQATDFTKALEARLRTVIREKGQQYQTIIERSNIPRWLAEFKETSFRQYSQTVLEDLEQIITDDSIELKKAQKVPLIVLLRLHRAILHQPIEKHRNFFQLVQSFSRTEANFQQFFIRTCQISFNFLVAKIAENNRRAVSDPQQKKALRIIFSPNKLIDNDVPFLNFLVRGMIFGADKVTSIVFYRGLMDKIGIREEYGTDQSILEPLWKMYLHFYPLYLDELHKIEREKKETYQPLFSPEQIAEMLPRHATQEDDVLLGQIMEGLEQFEPIDREIITRREVKGQSFKEIGEHFNISRQAVQKRYNKTLETLRKRFSR